MGGSVLDGSGRCLSGVTDTAEVMVCRGEGVWDDNERHRHDVVGEDVVYHVAYVSACETGVESPGHHRTERRDSEASQCRSRPSKRVHVAHERASVSEVPALEWAYEVLAETWMCVMFMGWREVVDGDRIFGPSARAYAQRETGFEEVGYGFELDVQDIAQTHI